jgi:DNA-binding NarL/FixJ family response regulator
VLVLSQHVEAHYALRLITERPDGASYLLKERVVDVAEFIDSVRRVANGRLVVDTEVVSEFSPALAASGRSSPPQHASATCSR